MVFSQLNWRIFRKQVAWNILFLCPAWLIGIVYCNDCDCVQPPLDFFSRNCLVVYHCTCSWSITKSFTIDSFGTNSMYQKHRGRRKAYRIENAASQDASITWKNWVSIIKEQNSVVAYVNGTVFLQYTIPLKTSRVSLFEGPFCKVVTDPHIMWNWQGGGGGAWSAVGVWVYSC